MRVLERERYKKKERDDRVTEKGGVMGWTGSIMLG